MRIIKTSMSEVIILELRVFGEGVAFLWEAGTSRLSVPLWGVM